MTKADQATSIGEFEQLTLLALLRLEPDAYGASIRREIETRADRPVQLGALYTTLDRLERKALVAALDGGADGRARRPAQEALSADTIRRRGAGRLSAGGAPARRRPRPPPGGTTRGAG